MSAIHSWLAGSTDSHVSRAPSFDPVRDAAVRSETQQNCRLEQADGVRCAVVDPKCTWVMQLALDATSAAWVRSFQRPMRYRRQLLLAMILVAIGAIAFAHYNLKLLSNSQLTERGTYAFYLLIASRVRDLPRHKPSAAPPVYFYAPGDVGPVTNALLYCAQTSREDIVTFYSTYFQTVGLERDNDERRISFGHGDERYVLEIVSEANCPTFVKINYFRY